MDSGESDELLKNLPVFCVEVPGNKVFFVTAKLLAARRCDVERSTPVVSGWSVGMGSV